MEYKIKKNILGTPQVHYYCPACKNPLFCDFRSAGMPDVCAECGHTHHVPGQDALKACLKAQIAVRARRSVSTASAKIQRADEVRPEEPSRIERAPIMNAQESIKNVALQNPQSNLAREPASEDVPRHWLPASERTPKSKVPEALFVCFVLGCCVWGMIIKDDGQAAVRSGSSDIDYWNSKPGAEYARVRLRQEFPNESEAEIRKATAHMMKFVEVENMRKNAPK